MVKFFLALSFLFLYSQVVHAVGSNTQSNIDRYSVMPAVSGMTLSPSGKLIAYRKHTEDLDSLVIFSLDQSRMLQALSLKDINLKNIYFASDDFLIIKVSETKKINGFLGKHEYSTAYSYHVETGEMTQLLVPGKGIYTGQTGLGDIIGISPDGLTVYMKAFTQTREIATPDYSLVSIRLDKKSTPKIIVKGSTNSQNYYLNSLGEVLAQQTYNEKSNLYKILAKDGKRWRTVYEEKTSIPSVSILGVAPDDKSLIIFSETDQGLLKHHKLSLETGQLSLIKRDQNDIGHIFSILDLNQKLTGFGYSSLKPSYSFFNKEVDDRFKAIQDTFLGNSVLFKSESNDYEHILVYVEGSTLSGDYFLFSKGVDKPTFLGSAYPDISGKHINPIGEVTITAKDGLRIPTLITIPRATASNMKNLPAVVLPHGGPESHDRIKFDWLAQAIASQGYLVIQPQFRGSSGFGQLFTEAGYGEWGKKMQTDLHDALSFFVKKGMVNADKVCIVGRSYGGYAALAAAAFTNNLYQCAASINGVSDLIKMLNSDIKEYGSHHWVIDYWERSMIDNAKHSSKQLKKLSPITFIENFDESILLIHGKDDKIVKIDQSKRLFMRLKKAKKTVEFIELKNTNHYLNTQFSREKVLYHLLSFLDENLQ